MRQLTAKAGRLIPRNLPCADVATGDICCSGHPLLSRAASTWGLQTSAKMTGMPGLPTAVLTKLLK